MYAHHAALRSSSFDGRDRTTHHQKTKQRAPTWRTSWTGEERMAGDKTRKAAPKIIFRSLDLSQLPVLTVASVVLVRHRVMWWSARCLQCAFTARCSTFQLPESAGLEWASGQVGGCWLSASGRQYVSTAKDILRRLCALCLRCICTAQCVLCLRPACAGPK